jgi:flagellin-like hook-associated protein FlgL
MQPVSTLTAYTRQATLATELRARIDATDQRIASGYKARTLAELGADALVSIDGRRAVGLADSFVKTIDQTRPRLEVTLSALDRIGTLAQQGIDAVLRQFGAQPPPLAVVASDAQRALRELQNVLNETIGDEYLFNGRMSQNPPVPGDILASGAFTQIQAQMNGLAPGNANAVIAATVASASSNAAGTTPFDDYISGNSFGGVGLTEDPVAAVVDVNFQLRIGLKANANAAAVSAGPSTTGSFARDIFRGLAILASLTDAQRAAAPDDFQQVLENVRTTLTDGFRASQQEAGILGQTSAQLDAIKRRHLEIRDALVAGVARVEDADIAQESARRSLQETQLQAVYRLIVARKDLNLANFIR